VFFVTSGIRFEALHIECDMWLHPQFLALRPSCAAMELRIRARLGAARLVLQETAGTATHAAVSRMQATALGALVAAASL